MKFEVIPIFTSIKDLYQIPISNARFEQYLAMLQGETKGDLKLPISGFNPMAKPHILQKLMELEALDIENTMQKFINKTAFSKSISKNKMTIQIAFNLADDLKGGWTNRHTTDFDSKFKINALVERHFSAPFFWASETYSTELIEKRTLEYLYRTIFQLENGRLKTLSDHLEQEVFVIKNTSPQKAKTANLAQIALMDFYKKNKTSDDYSLIFNFFYGNVAAQALNYPTYEIDDFAGFFNIY